MPAIRPNCLLRLWGRPVSTFHPPTFQLVLRDRKRTFRVHHLPHSSACSRSGASHILRHFPDCQMMPQHVVHLTLVDSFGRYITSPHEICYFFWAFFLTNSGKMFIDILKRRKLTIFLEIEYFQSFGTGYTILYVVFLTEMIPLVLAKNTYRSIPGNARRKALSSLLLFYC